MAERMRAAAAQHERDRKVFPILAIAAVVGGLLGAASFIATLIMGADAGIAPGGRLLHAIAIRAIPRG